MSKTAQKTYYFCGVGGSGMSALALICKQRGARIIGSDRAYDQGQSLKKFKDLEVQGIEIVSQDGLRINADIDALIVSSAVEDSIPDVAAAKAQNITIIKRAELLAQMFNEADIGISVAGTSGKSTVTGMIAHVLTQLGQDPTVMNGAVIKNLKSNMRVGSGPFVTETDESDGSIALYNPTIAVVNNIALDHKSLEELDQLFGDFIGRASKAVILNADDERLKSLADRAMVPAITYSVLHSANLRAVNIELQGSESKFSVLQNELPRPAKGRGHVDVNLNLPGEHNVSNALACLSVCVALNIDLTQAATALSTFEGIKRRMDVVGTKNGITVIDDFAHNPDKIGATLKTLKKFDGRLIVMFQPHGFGPLKLMGKEIAETFAQHLGAEDMLLMPEAYYAGGTVDRSITAQDVIEMVKARGIQAQWFETRSEIVPFIIETAQTGDRIVIMGARDDTLSDCAVDILVQL